MQLLNKRLFVEKKVGFQTEADGLCKELQEYCKLPLNKVRLFNIYDIFDIASDEVVRAISTIFSDRVVDEVYEDYPEVDGLHIAIETLPGQFDQRADSAVQCAKLLYPSSIMKVTTGKLLVLSGLDESHRLTVINYILNPIEARLKDCSILSLDTSSEITPLEKYDDFISYDDQQLEQFLKKHSLAMSFLDLKFVQDYFKNDEKRNPTETEIKVLDTYWSDHCRHTTFETELTSVVINSESFQTEIQEAYNRYVQLRDVCNRQEKPITCMDMATINSRYLRKKGMLDQVEISEEINACSVFIDVLVDGNKEKWLLQFKNETHNHPTEIEPFGGASTCIGGAIRDPLSGRSYVYQAMRLSGSATIFTPLYETMEGKLPQKIISQKSAHGNSSYGNQIGLATTFVKELYHPGFIAKHMEVGAVVGAVKAENIRRESPVCGDQIILLGGRTGRDGIGGATGSSKEHTSESMSQCASEVQKGNAPEERKIQRLFRNPECSKLIKKCNDFGAGGVCVAIGELADGLVIHLDKVRLKYEGLNPTEIAISESQERMAVVVDEKDVERFIQLAKKENLEAYQVAEVTDTNRLVMKYNDDVLVDCCRDFINTAGVRQKVDVEIVDSDLNAVIVDKEVTKESIVAMLSDENVACQKGMVEMFDASIGASSVMMPFGGKHQLTPTQASVSKIPVIEKETTTCSILTYGYNSKLCSYSPFTGAMFSVLESMAKVVACGGKISSTYFSFQEYFERLTTKEKWGKVTQSLLGAMMVQDYFNVAAIGGKDSMSGTFHDIHVPPTLISFACSTSEVEHIISPEFKKEGSIISVFLPTIDDRGYPCLDSYKRLFDNVEKGISDKLIQSAYVVEEGGIAASCFKMSFGNDIGFTLKTDLNVLTMMMGAIVVESEKELEGALVIGKTGGNDYRLNDIVLTKEEARHAWLNTMDEIYPRYTMSNHRVQTIHNPTNNRQKSKKCVDEVVVCIPVFPGTNCEIDTKKAFERAGAVCKLVMFTNNSEQDIHDSISALAHQIKNSQILAFPGGFSSGDEPDGSAKFIVNVINNETIKEAIEYLLASDGLILGICNGFQALIKSGLLPFGKIGPSQSTWPTLFHNDIHRHVSTMANLRLSTNNSPWLQDLTCGDIAKVALSHGEGKLIASEEMIQQLIDNNQIAFQYVDDKGNATSDGRYNYNGSMMAIEGLLSPCGRILGKMGHSERFCGDNFINIVGNKQQDIFSSGVNYFKKGDK